MKVVLLEVRNLIKVFETGFLRKVLIKAVDDVSFVLKSGEIVSVVGQSGSGKTTLAKMILRLLEPTSGDILFMGRNVWKDVRTPKELRWYWRNVHAVFQNPYSSFNPFYKVDRVLNQACSLVDLEPGSSEARAEVLKALQSVGLRADEVLGKYPHQLSGGQLQRVLIARAWIIKPKLLIADEPVSMLDVSTRGKIVKLFEDLRKEHDTTVVFITHDMGLAYVISDRIFVMYRGKVVEEGSPDELLREPKHEYTKTLVESVPGIYKKWQL